MCIILLFRLSLVTISNTSISLYLSMVRLTDGDEVGTPVDSFVGLPVGTFIGDKVGPSDAVEVGINVGVFVGLFSSFVGDKVDFPDGTAVRINVGSFVGLSVGSLAGGKVGSVPIKSLSLQQ